MEAVLANWRGLALRGVLAALFGIVTLAWPGLTLGVLVLLFGAFVLVDGIMMAGAALLKAAGTEDRRWWVLTEGILGIGAGLITLFWPGITALVLLYCIAVWAIVMGVLQIAAAGALRGQLKHDWVLAVAGVLTILFGIALMITPGAGALVITWLIGWFALINGILFLYMAWKVHHAEAAGGAMGQAKPLPA